MLNRQQQAIVKEKDGPIRILAGPGSGKTRTIVQRIVSLIKNKVKPNNILAITFTNKSALEMKSRINAIAKLSENEKVFVSTFHSFCAKLIRKNHRYIQDFRHDYSILDKKDKDSLIKKVIRELGLSKEEISVKEASDFISLNKARLYSDVDSFEI